VILHALLLDVHVFPKEQPLYVRASIPNVYLNVYLNVF
jgi:hypothetical protein